MRGRGGPPLRRQTLGSRGIVATVIGQSGAWHAIVIDIARWGHTVSTPKDIEPLLARLKADRQSAIESHRTETMRSVQERSARITQLSSEHGLFRRFFNGFKVNALRSEVKTLYAADARYPAQLDQTIRRIEALPGSPELAGAEAELAVIEHLRLLPDTFVVFNDVRLDATRHIYFDGAALQSAQLDHVALGPAGVFVIETKHWSQSFVDSGNYHDPFDQVARAGYLCYDLLHEVFGKTKVRSLIACVGSLPAPPQDTKVKVVRPAGLCTFITEYAYGKQELTAEQIEQLRAFFERRVATRLDS
jgi:hypothetical protein